MIGFEKRTVWEFLLGQKGLKNYFGTGVAKVVALSQFRYRERRIIIRILWLLPIIV